MAVIGRLRASFDREFRSSSHSRKMLGDRFRHERRTLGMLFEESSPQPGTILDVAKRAFANRSRRIVDALRPLRMADGALPSVIEIQDFASSHVHMHINRLVRSDPRRHELVLYDFLFRIYEAQQARARKNNSDTLQVVNETEIRGTQRGAPIRK